jgi:hypothetical protein
METTRGVTAGSRTVAWTQSKTGMRLAAAILGVGSVPHEAQSA